MMLLVVMFILQIGSSWSESQTIDEAVNLTAGYSYLTTGDYRLNPEHPPLIKMFSALPLLALDLTFDTSSSDWQSAEQWSFSRSFIYENTVPGELLLQLGRVPNMLLSLLLGWVIFSLTRSFFGPKAGLLALTLYVFDPLFLAHSHYVTTDTGAALFFLLTVFSWYRYLRSYKRSDLINSALFFALAQVTKFSAVVLLPILIILFFIARWQARLTPPDLIKKNVDKGRSFPRFSLWSLGWAVAVLAVATLLLALVLYRESIGSYLAGLQYVRWHNATGHTAFLFGEYSTTGWWYYFPSAWLVKTPLATVILLLFTFIAWIKKSVTTFILRKQSSNSFWKNFIVHLRNQPLLFYTLFIPPLIYVLWSMTSHINLGVRHLSVIYPFIFIAIGTLALLQLQRWQRWWQVVLFSLLAVYVSMSLYTYPRYISYFSELVGGSHQGYKYLLDSNLDWSQSFYYLRDFLRQRGWQHETIFLATLTTSDPRTYDISWQSFPPEAKNAASLSQLPPGIYVLAASYSLTGDTSLQWLLDQYPREQVGDAFFVYDLRQ